MDMTMPNHSPSPRHVIFGTGQVGSLLAQRLLERGYEVRVAKRSPGGIPPGAEAMLGDAADPTFCTAAAEGAATAYHCMNPPYSTKVWAEFVPRYMANLIEATARAGARLVVLNNVYMLGKPDGKPLSADTPMNPCSRKGEIRAKAAQLLFDAHQRGDLRATSGRASDFYGPGGTLTQLGDYFWPRVLKGRRGQAIANPDAIHTYHYNSGRRRRARDARLRARRCVRKAVDVAMPASRNPSRSCAPARETVWRADRADGRAKLDAVADGRVHAAAARNA